MHPVKNNHQREDRNDPNPRITGRLLRRRHS
jgi:hypothetical protein